jgi:hypothetical protein
MQHFSVRRTKHRGAQRSRYALICGRNHGNHKVAMDAEKNVLDTDLHWFTRMGGRELLPPQGGAPLRGAEVFAPHPQASASLRDEFTIPIHGLVLQGGRSPQDVDR